MAYLFTFVTPYQFSEIMDKISGYIGKQRKNSEGEFDSYLNCEVRIFFPLVVLKEFHRMSLLCAILLVSGPVEADPEYRLIVAANNLTVEIDNELSKLSALVTFVLQILKAVICHFPDFTVRFQI